MLARMQSRQRLAAWTAAIALLLQALYAVPAAERMMLSETLSASPGAVICLAGGGKLTADLPGKTKAHCPICLSAALSALAAVIGLLAARPSHRAAEPSCGSRLLLRPSLPRAHRSRAPPAPV